MVRVLIVEDDFRIAKIHEEFIEKIEGFTVVGKVLNATEGLSFLEEQSVDLILLDIYMPDKLGTEFMSEVRKMDIPVNFIVITAADHKDYLEECLRNGVFSYLIKPVTFETFQNVMESFQERQQLLEQKETIDQEFVNHVLNKLSQSPTQKTTDTLPKGINPLTLDNVLQIIQTFSGGVTAEEIGKEMGASRTTARRYLEYLISIGKVDAQLEYGIVGRPERKYRSI